MEDGLFFSCGGREVMIITKMSGAFFRNIGIWIANQGGTGT
ncbi:hypothetical protein B2K_38355 [Paenibacillus mucilaginosus K02]|uniref:Uncharacterized protein n=1 Tax=Paenibacillus mucilaginosus K02 TaxID=997761 RepID=R9UL48_9BACL|nr:hypothetical protein B2K_38355 [Paenibacillus mucilaginosus K02]